MRGADQWDATEAAMQARPLHCLRLIALVAAATWLTSTSLAEQASRGIESCFVRQ